MSTDPLAGWQAFSDAARSFLSAPAHAAHAPQGAAAQFSDFLREQFATWSQPWAGLAAHPAPASSLPPGLSKEAPAFGATREHQQRAQRMAQAAQRMDAAQRRLQRLWSDVLREAATRFVATLGPAPHTASTPEGLRKLYDSWIDCAEEAYSRVAHGQDFCQAQAQFANAASQWRLEQQANIEQWSKFLDLPTRSEINSLIHRVRELEQQRPSQPQGQSQPRSKAAARPRTGTDRKPATKRAKVAKKRS